LSWRTPEPAFEGGQATPQPPRGPAARHTVGLWEIDGFKLDAGFQQVRNEGHVAGEAVELGDNELALWTRQADHSHSRGRRGARARFEPH